MNSTDLVFVKYPPPLNYDESHHELFKETFKFSYSDSDKKFQTFYNVFLTHSGIGIKGFRLVKATVHPWKYAQKYFWTYAVFTRLFRKRISLPGNQRFLLIHNHWSGGYYHWIVEALHKLFLVKDSLSEFTLLFPEQYNKDALDSLKAFEINRIFFIPRKTVLFIPQLIVPGYSLGGKNNPGVTIAIREYFHSHLEKLDQTFKLNFGKRIYISRAKAGKRKIINEKDVTELLMQHGFGIIQSEDYQFWQEVSIMFNAQVLISIHGAGLTNLLFMKEKSYVIEFHKEICSSGDFFHDDFYKLASKLGINYLYQFCKPKNPSQSIHDADIYVDLDLLRKNLEYLPDSSA